MFHDAAGGGGGTSIQIMIRKSEYQKYRYMPEIVDKYPYSSVEIRKANVDNAR